MATTQSTYDRPRWNGRGWRRLTSLWWRKVPWALIGWVVALMLLLWSLPPAEPATFEEALAKWQGRRDTFTRARIACLEEAEQLSSLQGPACTRTQALVEAWLSELVSDFERHPGLREALHNPFSPKEGTTDDAAPRASHH